MTALLIAILAHLISDFWFQTDSIVQKKTSQNIMGFILHGLIVFITMFTLLILKYSFTSTLIYSLCVSLLHALIDYLKYFYVPKNNASLELSGFITDQMLHLTIIVFFWAILSFNEHNVMNNIISLLLKSRSLEAFNTFEINQKIFLPNSILMTLIIYIATCFGGSFLIPKILKVLCGQKLNIENKFGQYIGIFERFLIITFIITQNIASIALLLLAKSIASCNEVENNFDFKEHYFLGTLLSISVGVIGGFSLNYFLSIIKIIS